MSLRVAAIELPARHGDAEAQLARLDRALAPLSAGGPTLAVLPARFRAGAGVREILVVARAMVSSWKCGRLEI